MNDVDILKVYDCLETGKRNATYLLEELKQGSGGAAGGAPSLSIRPKKGALASLSTSGVSAPPSLYRR